MKFLCDQCKAKYQIADEKAAGKTIRMKCRKCGHAIEVRAAIMESSAVSSSASSPAFVSPPAPAAPTNPKAPPPRPEVPLRPSALATSLAAKPVARERSATNTGSFQSVGRRHEAMPSVASMSEVTASDEWYVAINGVPVGPIRIAEVRRKAALGAVTEDSLAWQDGLDEWRPVRAFPALAAIVREAFATGRASFPPPPPPPGRASLPPPPPRAASARSAVVPPPPRAPPPPRPAPPPPQQVHARSNVVPITSRLATAEKLEEAHDEPTRALSIREALGSSPFDPALVPPPADRASAVAPVVSADPFAPAAPDRRGRRQIPWAAIAMVAAAVAFGVIGGMATFFRQPPQGPAPVAVQVPVIAPPTVTAAPPPVVPSVVEPVEHPLPTVVARKAGTGGGPGKEKESPPAPRGLLDLHSFAQNQTTVTPSEEPGGEAPKAAGQCFSSAQVQQVIGLHKTAIQRSCWERNPTNKLAVNVSVSFTIEPDGATQGVAASAEEPSVAKCVENDVRGWHFPALGCSQATQFSYKFVRQ